MRLSGGGDGRTEDRESFWEGPEDQTESWVRVPLPRRGTISGTVVPTKAPNDPLRIATLPRSVAKGRSNAANADGVISANDLAILLSAWGGCP